MGINNRNAISNIDPQATAIQTELSYAQAGPVADQVEFSGLWEVFRRRRLLMLVTLVAVLMVGAIYTLLVKPVYESTALVMVVASPPASSSADGMSVLNNLMAFTRSASVESHLQLIQSPEVLSTAAARLEPSELRKGFESNIVPKWAISITTPVKDSEVISVMGRAYDARAAADLANSIAITYIERDQAFSTQATKQGKEYVYSEMNTVRKQLASAQDDLAAYKRTTRLVVPESQLQAVTNNVAALQMELDKANVDAAAALRQAESLGRQVSVEGTEVQESRTIQMNPEYQAAMQRLDGLNAKRATMIQEYAPESKEIKKLDGEIKETQRQMKNVAETVVASKVHARNPAINTYMGSVVSSAAADAKARALRGVLSMRNKEMDRLPERERNMARLMQKVNVLDHTYQSLSEKYYALLVNEKSILPNARLASAAYPARRPAVPNKPMNAVIFMLLGLMLSVGVAAVAEKLDKKVRDEGVVSRMTGEPIIALIPSLNGMNGARLQIDRPDCDDAFVEAFRNLRNVVSFSMEEHPMKLLAVTSPGRGEGKTTVSINLAIAMAFDGKKVLLIDCDLRRPSVRSRLNLDETSRGLTNLIKGRMSIEDAIMPTGVENLYCLPSGPYLPNPAEFLNCRESKETLRALSEKFDVLILDCPPSAGLSDMQVVARMVDGVLLVVSVDQTLRVSLHDTMRRLGQVDAPIVGTVINRASMSRTEYEYYHYSGDEGADTNGQPQLAEPKT